MIPTHKNDGSGVLPPNPSTTRPDLSREDKFNANHTNPHALGHVSHAPHPVADLPSLERGGPAGTRTGSSAYRQHGDSRGSAQVLHAGSVTGQDRAGEDRDRERAEWWRDIGRNRPSVLLTLDMSLVPDAAPARRWSRFFRWTRRVS